MVTGIDHFSSLFSDPKFSEFTHTREGLCKQMICASCKVTIGDNAHLNSMEHMLVMLLKITTRILTQMQVVPPTAPLDQLLISHDIISEEEKQETLLNVVQNIVPKQDWLAKLRRQSTATATKYS